MTCTPVFDKMEEGIFPGGDTDCEPRANNRHLKRKIEYPVLRYGWTDHGGLVMTMYQISGTGTIVGVSVTGAKYYKDDALN